MRHQRKSRRFGMSPSHRRAVFRNMVTSLFVHERIRTTLERAKELRRVAEKLITLGKRGDLAARRLAARTLRTQAVKEGIRTAQKEVALKKLFENLAQRYRERPGGYTRIIRIGRRHGDNASLALLEMLPEESKVSSQKTTRKKSSSKTTKTTKTAKTATPKTTRSRSPGDKTEKAQKYTGPAAKRTKKQAATKEESNTK